jgi:predicted ester cyclase
MATTAEENTELHVRVEAEELWTEKNLDVLDEYYTEDFLHHSPDSQELDLAGYEAYTREFHAAFPDSHIEVHDTMVDGDMTVVGFTYHGTWEGTFRGMEPTGAAVSVDGISMARIADGKFAEIRRKVDNLGMLAQMGVIELPE